MKTIKRDCSQQEWDDLTLQEKKCFQLYTYFYKFEDGEDVPVDDPVIFACIA